MPRPTVHDVARAAGVSVATVDRVLNARNNVRPSTQARVLEAMRRLDYERDIAAANLSRRREYRIRFILPQGSNTFMRTLECEIQALRKPLEAERVDVRLETVPAFDATALADALDHVEPGEADGLAVVAADAPIVRSALDRARDRGLHVVTLVSDVPSSRREHFVGIDNVVAGRTAGGLLGRFCRGRPGAVAVVAGSMVLRDHVERRLGFEQVMRAEFGGLELLPSLEGLDDAARVEEMLSALLGGSDRIVGIYSLGAGSRGVARAVAAVGAERRPAVVVHELTVHAREALQTGLFDAVINQDPGHEVRSAVRVLKALIEGRSFVPAQERIRVDIFMRDNLP